MAKKISELTTYDGTPTTSSEDVIPVVQNDTTKKISLGNILTAASIGGGGGGASNIDVFNIHNMENYKVYTANSDYLVFNAMDEYSPDASQYGKKTDIEMPYNPNLNICIDLGDLTNKRKYLDCANIGTYAYRTSQYITFLFKFNNEWYCILYYPLNGNTKISIRAVDGKIHACITSPAFWRITDEGYFHVQYDGYNDEYNWNEKYDPSRIFDETLKTVISNYIQSKS